MADVDLVLTSNDIEFTVDDQVDNSPTLGDVVKITATVKNSGTDTNATGFYVRFLDGANVLSSVQVNQNVTFGGGTLDVSYQWTATGAGPHTMWVQTDYTNVISESDEDNNNASKQLDVNIAPTANIQVDKTSALTLVNFAFNTTGSSDPDGNIVSYLWAFGDGSFAATSSATHAYKDDGVYTVTLLVTDNDGGTDTATQQITVLNRDPVAKAVDQTRKTYEKVWFDSSNSTDADGSIVNTSWYFSHTAQYKYGKKVTFTYTDDGVYTVNLTVMDDDGATHFLILHITVQNRAPTANIEANRTKINTTMNITFNGTKSTDMDGGIVNYTWLFPGGVNRYGPVVSYQFNLPNGSYQITLVVTDDDGAIGYTSIFIKVGNKKPIANPGLDTIADTYEIMTFDGSKSYDPDGKIVNFTWDMGDGKKRYNSTFTYFYTNDGIYNVRLTVVDDEGASATATITAEILNRAPDARHSPVTIHTYIPFVFNTSECIDIDGYIASVTWTFRNPDGSQTVINGNTTYQWNSNGTYQVRMDIWDDDGATDFYFFNVTVMNSAPWAIFSYSPTTSISVGDNVTFDASASLDLDGNIVEWVWFFGDGPQSTGEGETIVHRYAKDGFFTVELIVTDNNGGANSTMKTLYVAPKNDPPVAIINCTALEMMTNRTINFDALESYDPDGFIIKYEWNFGDGQKSYGVSVGHKYYYPGTYNVTLLIEDNGTKTDSDWYIVSISQAPNLLPVATIEIDEQYKEHVAGTKIILDGRSSYDSDGYIVNYTWDFGDGTTKYSSFVSKTYASTAVGTKTIRLTVRDNMGGSDTADVTVTVLAPPKKNVPPTAQFSFSPAEPITTGQDIRFDASASSDTDGTITGYTWLFGDGTFAEGKTVTHQYTSNKVFLVVLTVIDNNGGSGTISKEITISNRAPIASAIASKTTVNTLETITFDASKSSDPDGIIMSYTWVFGKDAVTKTGKVATYAFISSGTQTVTLKVLDDDGATTSIDIEIKVNNRPPIARAGTDFTMLEDKAVEFDGANSKDLDGYIQTYRWEMGDGTTLEGSTVTHTYSLPSGSDTATYTVTLTVYDDAGAPSDPYSLNVTVVKPPPPPKPPKEEGFIPGFGAFLAVASIAVAVVAVAYSRKRNY